MKSFKQHITEDLGDTSLGQSRLARYIKKAEVQRQAFDTASRIFLSRASDPNAIESPKTNIEKAFKMRHKAVVRASGINRARSIKKKRKK